MKRVLGSVMVLLMISGIACARDLPPYYQNLADACIERDGHGHGCCMSSVYNMAQDNALVMPPEGCPPGTTRHTLKCPTSYSWCILLGADSEITTEAGVVTDK